jgi:hypothetical protein
MEHDDGFPAYAYNGWDQTIISGGDRHGCEPSAVLNLTNAKTFSEFIDEIR